MTGVHAYPKACRIRRRREFLEIQGSGRRRRSPNFVIIQRPSTSGSSRIGITVSSRVGNSVVRNRVKRFVREVFRAHRHEIESRAVDSVVIARPGADRMGFADIERELHDLLGGERVGPS